MVVGLSSLFIYKVAVIGTYEFYIVFAGKFYKDTVNLLLQGECLPIGTLTRVFHLMALKLEIEVISPQILMPLNRFTGPLNITCKNLLRNFTTYTCRADNKVLVIALQIFMVSTRTMIKAINPGVGNELYEVAITSLIFCKDDKMPATTVNLRDVSLFHATTSHIHLTSKDWLEERLAFFLEVLVCLVYLIKKLLDAKHITVVSNSNTWHIVLYGFLDNIPYLTLTVKQGVVRMHMKMNKTHIKRKY